MNPYLEPQGFLGTGASLLADVTLVAYLLLIIPAMLVGLVYARRGKHRPHHKWLMTAITLINWILIVFLMFAAYRFDIAGNIAAQPTNTRYLLPTLHGLLGIPAQLLATFVIWRMFREDSQVARAKRRGEKDTSIYWFKRAKPVMWLTLVLWLATATLGVFSYFTRYDVIPAYALSVDIVAPMATDELLPPAETPEAPVVTEEAATGTDETLSSAAPIETEDALIESPTRRAAATRTLPAPQETDEALEPAETAEFETGGQ
jgi:uncharacterized membrane protein YozB (DUF420 family)